MSSALKCRNCGSNDIEEDNARGDAVCTNCGSVLEDSLIVSEVQFEEAGHGATAIGQFVAGDSSGGATNYGYGKFQVGSGNESREVTIKKAKREITNLCQQLQLSQHYIDTALNFFKMALVRHLTRGRKSTHIYAACVYITCRTEGTSHLLIDISDVQQICSYELGRTYLKLSTALCINVPAIDPCLYVLRFASKLQFGPRTHEVSNTALRIVQRMKKDSMHSGRRPTGICGAALLMAARMHEYNRSIGDIVRVVKIHETTVRKRLTEFAETPSSWLTLDEFMSVDLEAEQDPPAFKAARKKDRDRIKDIKDNELSLLQKEIDFHLEKDVGKKVCKRLKQYMKMGLEEAEDRDAADVIEETTLEVFQSCISETNKPVTPKSEAPVECLGPNLELMCRPSASELLEVEQAKEPNLERELDCEGLDDTELDNYLLTTDEADYKKKLWLQLNCTYLKDVKEREERLAKDLAENKGEPKKRRRPRKRPIGPSSSAGEAIEKMLQEKKISSKINYDILKTLNDEPLTKPEPVAVCKAELAAEVTQHVKQEKPSASRRIPEYTSNEPKKIKVEVGLPVAVDEPVAASTSIIFENDAVEEPDDVDNDTEPEPEPEPEYSSLKDMLNKGDDDDYYGYDDDNY